MLPLILQFFGPALAGLFDNLVKRAKAGWEVSVMKAGLSVGAVQGLAYAMGCDLSLLTPAIYALPAVILTIFEVPANMIMPTIVQAMRDAVEQKKKSDAVLADAQKLQDEAREKYGIKSIALLLMAGLLAACSAAQIQKTEAVLVKLKADATRVAIAGCANLPVVDVSIGTALDLLPPGTTIDDIERGWAVAEPQIRAFCEKLEQQRGSVAPQ